MNVIQQQIIKQAYQNNFTEEQINILKKSNLGNYDLYLLYKKIYNGQCEKEE